MAHRTKPECDGTDANVICDFSLWERRHGCEPFFCRRNEKLATWAASTQNPIRFHLTQAATPLSALVESTRPNPAGH
jgi:hypothetical protein